jgi:hypothetical protein
MYVPFPTSKSYYLDLSRVSGFKQSIHSLDLSRVYGFKQSTYIHTYIHIYIYIYVIQEIIISIPFFKNEYSETKIEIPINCDELLETIWEHMREIKRWRRILLN